MATLFLAVATSGCATLEDGRTQEASFLTPIPAQYTLDRANRWLAANAYVVLEQDLQFTHAERTRGRQVDVLKLYLAEAPEGTQVRLLGGTDELQGTRRSRSAGIAPATVADVQALSDVLHVRP